ncbi:MAG: Asp-tRNA(Asn)/Glu-tRNA(Gln) amidotransferase subunit GatC [Deltaproteobacteria bacterium]|nr:Asp-tRNA(Asn)/Glu-tRNA(Gln) amidotransferase subunit GatC [Deltaproteobacteria bacterium]
MRITEQEVARIARLARLEPTGDQTARYAKQMDTILEYMDVLESLDTQGVEPMYSPLPGGTVFRADEVESRYTRDEILANAPDTDGVHFIVPKTVF